MLLPLLPVAQKQGEQKRNGEFFKVQQCYELMVQKKYLTKEGLAHVWVLQKDLREIVLLEKIETK